MIVRGGESIVTPDDRQGAGRNTQVSVHVSVNGPNGVSESNSLRSHSVMLARHLQERFSWAPAPTDSVEYVSNLGAQVIRRHYRTCDTHVFLPMGYRTGFVTCT